MTVARGFSDDQFISGASAAGLALLPTDVREAEHKLREAWTEANHHGLVNSAIEAGWWFVRALHLRGALAEAEGVAKECIDLGRRIGERSRTLTEIEAFIPVLETSTGNWRSATEELRRLAAAEADPHYRIGLHFQLATALARYGDDPFRDEISERLVTARAGAEEVACSRCLNDVLLRGTEAWARVGDVPSASAWLADYEQRPEVGPRPWRHRRASVSVCVARGEADASVAGLEDLHREAVANGIELEALWAVLDLGAVLAGHDPDRAKAVFEGAASDADRLGATNERRLAEQRLRRLGARTWSRGRVGELLSDRELKIAAMVADGCSNPEIAQALFVSRKTVERHVSNILAKVGARNRADLARRMAEGSLGSS
ncbi:MAG: helix-turn-helix transcriptional regulator [Microthrixaceae bacterium]